MNSMASGTRIALRALLRRPGFAVVAVLTIALGVGATTAIFSAAYPILFAPLPYPEPNRVVSIKQVANGVPDDRVGFATIVDIRAQTNAFERVAAATDWPATLTGRAEPELVEGLRVTSEYFSVLGVAPALGRDFRPEDDVRGAPATVILSQAVWHRRFGGDSALVGHTITVNGLPYLVIGVLPQGFENALAPGAQVWRPLQYELGFGPACRSCQHLEAVGRLRRGVSDRQAARDVDVVLERLGREHPTDYPQHVGGTVVRLGEDLTRGVRPAMLAAFGAVLVVLLIACANTSNLLLGRVTERRAELSLRSALGANRARTVSPLLAEVSLLTGVGGVLGVGFAWVGIRTLILLAPPALPRLQAIALNAPVMKLALVATALVATAVALLPAWHAAGTDPHEGLAGTSRRTVGAIGRARSLLVIVETALAVLVLVASGLLLRSMRRLLDVDPGFDPQGVVTMRVLALGPRFANDTVTRRVFERVLQAVRAVPGIDRAAITSQLPLSGDDDTFGIHSERHPNPKPESDPSAHRYAVSSGYLETMRIPLLRGRAFTSDDRFGTPRVALVSAAFARRGFPNEEAIGQRIHVGAIDEPWWTIVGITGDVHQVSLGTGVADAVYVPETQSGSAAHLSWLVFRSRGNPSAIASVARRAVWSVDKDLPIARVSTMQGVVDSSAASRRFVLTLFESFALIAIVLAALGLYGVLAATVAERVREIGVREALGATPGQIVGMIVGRGMRLTGAGVSAGVALSLAGNGIIADQLFGVSRMDGLTYMVVVGSLGAVALAACAVPARRAAQVDPITSLRAE
jgi:predicted permease